MQYLEDYMGSIMYVREVAKKVRNLEEDVTLLGKRNFTSFGGESYDLIFHSLPIKCPRTTLKKDDLIIPMVPASISPGLPKQEILKFNKKNPLEGVFSYNSQSPKGALLKFIQMRESSNGYDIEKLCSAEVNEKVLEEHGYLDEIKYLRGDFNLDYTGFLNFPNIY
tara:strand:+ start:802 stop:1299 length:498 start_codon:yes stop_codon:yes gene_type:complete